MSDVEQYEPGLEDKGNPKMYEMGAQGGRWVLASAYDALAARLDEALRLLERARTRIVKTGYDAPDIDAFLAHKGESNGHTTGS